MPIPAPPAARPPRHWWAGPLLLSLAIVAAWLVWSPLGANDVVGGDEGYYGTMARNLLADARQRLGPSLTPLGAPGDKPPLYPALLAVSIRALGPTEVALRWPTVVSALAIALALAALLVRVAGAGGALAAVALLLALPWFADASRVAAAEPPLTALGAAAVAIACGGATRTRGILAGVLLGLAFLCKLWLVAPLALAVTAALWPRSRRESAPLLLAAGSALAMAAAQLAALALADPARLPHWAGIYLGFSLAARAGGEGFADYWLLPPGYYAGLLAHALVLHLPLAALGVVAAWRRRAEPAPRALLMWAAGVVPLSLFAVKSGVYAYVLLPAWAGLAALGAAELARGGRTAWAVMAMFAAAGSPWIADRLGDRAVPLPGWAAAWGAAALALAAAAWRPAWARAAAAALVVAVAAGGLAREAQRLPYRYHVTGYRAVTATLAPHLAGVPAERVAYVSPEAPALAFHLFRTGRYWGTPVRPWRTADLAAVAADTALRAFVVDPDARLYGSGPDSTALAWLEASTREVTADAEALHGGPLGLRVFVRER